MKIRMFTTAAGPDGVFQAGKVYNLPKAKANAYLKAGSAHLVEEPKEKPKPEPKPETEPKPEPEPKPETESKPEAASIGSAEETTSKKPAEKKRRGLFGRKDKKKA